MKGFYINNKDLIDTVLLFPAIAIGLLIGFIGITLIMKIGIEWIKFLNL